MVAWDEKPRYSLKCPVHFSQQVSESFSLVWLWRDVPKTLIQGSLDTSKWINFLKSAKMTRPETVISFNQLTGRLDLAVLLCLAWWFTVFSLCTFFFEKCIWSQDAADVHECHWISAWTSSPKKSIGKKAHPALLGWSCKQCWWIFCGMCGCVDLCVDMCILVHGHMSQNVAGARLCWHSFR